MLKAHVLISANENDDDSVNKVGLLDANLIYVQVRYPDDIGHSFKTFYKEDSPRQVSPSDILILMITS